MISQCVEQRLINRNFTDDQIAEIAEELRGTPASLEGVMNVRGSSEDALTSDDHQELDQHVFCCEECGWWCELSEMLEDRDGVCDDHIGY